MSRPVFHLVWLVAGFALFGGACSSKTPTGSPAGDSALPGDPGLDRGDLAPSDESDGDSNCTSQSLTLAALAPRLMLAVEQSNGMAEHSPWNPLHSYWEETRTAVTELVSVARDPSYFFGLDAFPDGTLEYLENCYDVCCANPVCLATDMVRCMGISAQCTRGCAVDLPPVVAMDDAAVARPEIIAYLSLPYLPVSFSSTPLVDQLAWYAAGQSEVLPEFYANDGSSLLVLVSLTSDACAGTSVAEVAGELATLAAELFDTWGIRSVAVGFGGLTGDLADELDAITAHGGTSFEHFLAVDQSDALQQALERVAVEATPCRFDIGDPELVTDAGRVHIFGNGSELIYDEACADGWRWSDQSAEHLQIELCGPTCATRRSEEGLAVTAQLTCD